LSFLPPALHLDRSGEPRSLPVQRGESSGRQPQTKFSAGFTNLCGTTFQQTSWSSSWKKSMQSSSIRTSWN